MAFTTTHGIKDLESFAAIESAMFVKWGLPSGDEFLSDYNTPVTIDGDIYTSIGNLLEITAAMAELRATAAELTIAISGIPANAVTDLLATDIKGSTIKITRIYMNKQGIEEESYIVFSGIVTNYSVTDSLNAQTKTSSSIITLTVNNIVEVLSKKVNGRKTNPEDFPNDDAFKRVRLLKDRKFGFGGANK